MAEGIPCILDWPMLSSRLSLPEPSLSVISIKRIVLLVSRVGYGNFVFLRLDMFLPRTEEASRQHSGGKNLENTGQRTCAHSSI